MGACHVCLRCGVCALHILCDFQHRNVLPCIGLVVYLQQCTHSRAPATIQSLLIVVQSCQPSQSCRAVPCRMNTPKHSYHFNIRNIRRTVPDSFNQIAILNYSADPLRSLAHALYWSERAYAINNGAQQAAPLQCHDNDSSSAPAGHGLRPCSRWQTHTAKARGRCIAARLQCCN